MVSPYPPDLVFMIQFSTETDLGRTGLRGRVEHIESGRSTRFNSWPEIEAFVIQVLELQGVSSHPVTAQSSGNK